jgi:hypothetical protein
MMSTRAYPELRVAYSGMGYGELERGAGWYRATTGEPYLYDVSNESMGQDSLREIRRLSAGMEAADFIAGGVTMPLRLASAVQEASGIRCFNLVDREPAQLLHVADMINKYNSAPSEPTYDVEAKVAYDHREIRVEDSGSYGAYSFSEAGRTWYRISKPPFAESTEVVLHRSKIDEYLQELDDAASRKRFVYLSNVLLMPVMDKGAVRMGETLWMPASLSQELLWAIAEKEAIKEGSLFLAFPSIYSPMLFTKAGGTLEPVPLPDGEYRLGRVGDGEKIAYASAPQDCERLQQIREERAALWVAERQG